MPIRVPLSMNSFETDNGVNTGEEKTEKERNRSDCFERMEAKTHNYF